MSVMQHPQQNRSMLPDTIFRGYAFVVSHSRLALNYVVGRHRTLTELGHACGVLSMVGSSSND